MPETAAVGVIMGSQSDWETMRHAVETLEKLGINHETRIISAHRTPARLNDYVEPARRRGLKVIIAGAGGAAALPGAVAALTPLPVLGVPMLGWALQGLDAALALANPQPRQRSSAGLTSRSRQRPASSCAGAPKAPIRRRRRSSTMARRWARSAHRPMPRRNRRSFSAPAMSTARSPSTRSR